MEAGEGWWGMRGERYHLQDRRWRGENFASDGGVLKARRPVIESGEEEAQEERDEKRVKRGVLLEVAQSAGAPWL